MKSLFQKMDKPLLFWTIVMFSFGLIMIFSASSVKAALQGNPYSVFLKQAITLVICLFVSLTIILTPTKVYKNYAPIALYAIIGCLFFVFSYGAVINSAKRWIDLGFYSFQPSEFAKTILIVYMGVYYHKYKNSLNPYVVYKPLLYGMLICGLVFFQPDLGTTLIILMMMLFIFFSVPIEKELKDRVWLIGAGGMIIVSLFVLVGNNALLNERQMNRFKFTTPCQRYTENTGYQVCNGFIAINNGASLLSADFADARRWAFRPDCLKWEKKTG